LRACAAAAIAGFLLLAVASCGREEIRPEVAAADASLAGIPEGRGSPNARPDVVQTLRENRGRPRHPSDGEGRAWLEADAGGGGLAARVGVARRFVVVFEAGPLGIAAGGTLFFRVPLWGWSEPQLGERAAPGFTVVTTDAAGVVLTPEVIAENLLAIGVAGRALAAGERVRIEYGAGPALAEVDRFAEQGSTFLIGVDGDGDGVRAWLAESPEFDVAAGPPARLVLHLPATAKPGERLPLRIAVLDANGNAGVAFEGAVRLEFPAGLEGPAELALAAGARGVAQAELHAERPGTFVVRARGPVDLAAESNPLVVSPDGPVILFGDLHGHSSFSDGTGTVEDYYRYARDVAALDVAALTDHDHWGAPFLDERPDHWRHIEDTTSRFYDPGRFVTILGYEWTSWIYGHRHVLHFEETAHVRSFVDESFDTPGELWAALRGSPALTFAHHSAGEPVATDWSIPPDPELEPVTEIVSVHGSSESADTQYPIEGMIPGNTVRDALARGYRLGFVGSGDSHDGHPGLVHLKKHESGGIAGILASARTREAVLDALRARRVYATNGPRIVLVASLDGAPMGASVRAGASHRLLVKVVGTEGIDAVELLTPDGTLSRMPGRGRRFVFQWEVPASDPGSWLYVRVRQRDGGAAWSSPFFFE